MDNYLVEWYVDIYKNVYGLNTDYTDIILTFNTYLKRIINGTAFTVFSNIVIVLGIVLLLYHFFSDMADRAASLQVSLLSTAKSFGFLFLSILVIFHTKEIFIFLMRVMEWFGEAFSVADRGSASISNFLSNEVVLTLLDRCVKKYFAIWTVIGYTLTALPLTLICFGTKLYVTYFAATRIIQLFVYYVFAPIGVADIFEGAPGGGINIYSSGMRYLRVMVSIMLQLAVIAAVSLTFPMITTSIKNSFYESRVETVDNELGELESQYSISSTYPLRNFTYTDHKANVVEVVVNKVQSGANKVITAIEALTGKDVLDGTVKELDYDNTGDDKEVQKLSNVVSGSGEILDSDAADEILTDQDYRMTVKSTQLFFDWCTGSDGLKISMMLLLMAVRVMALLTAPKLCNYIVGVSN